MPTISNVSLDQSLIPSLDAMREKGDGRQNYGDFVMYLELPNHPFPIRGENWSGKWCYDYVPFVGY